MSWFLLMMWLLPSLWAWFGGHQDAAFITIVNVILGWFPPVWIILAIWAGAKPKPCTRQHVPEPTGRRHGRRRNRNRNRVRMQADPVNNPPFKDEDFNDDATETI